MKKIIALLMIVWQLAPVTQAQKTVHFKVHYKPEMKYIETLDQISETSIKYSGSKKFLQGLKDKGINNPTVNKKATRNEIVFTTGKLNEAERFPVAMEFVKSTSSDEKYPIPNGTIFYGYAGIEKIPVFDSMASTEFDESTKKLFLKSMQNILGQLSLPEKDLKVGESFSRETPLALPIGGNNIEMLIVTHYKLTGVTNGIATFDIVQDYQLKSGLTSNIGKATGKGKGQILYDIANGFYIKYESNGNMQLTRTMDNYSFVVNVAIGYSQKIVLAGN